MPVFPSVDQASARSYLTVCSPLRTTRVLHHTCVPLCGTCECSTIIPVFPSVDHASAQSYLCSPLWTTQVLNHTCVPLCGPCTRVLNHTCTCVPLCGPRECSIIPVYPLWTMRVLNHTCVPLCVSREYSIIPMFPSVDISVFPSVNHGYAHI